MARDFFFKSYNILPASDSRFNWVRRGWEKREYLGNARTAEPHLPQTGMSLEYKGGGLMMMAVMQDGGGSPLEDPPGSAAQAATFTLPGN